MTPEAQRIAIAEACGWTVNPDPKDHSGHRYYAPKGTSPFLGRHALPEYLNDLNAMKSAENTLSVRGKQDYISILRNICTVAGCWPETATAPQRAEAFLRTIGKWEEEAKP
jgi:hypothetical protein